MKNVLWSSRHDLGASQSSAVRKILGDELSYDYKTVTWANSDSEEDDNAENAYIWVELAAQYDVVVGIFPPTALVGLWLARDEADDGNPDFEAVRRLKILTPIARVYYTFDKVKKFDFLRMQEI